MAHHTVKPRGDDLLIFLNLDRAGQVCIFAHDLGVHGVAKEKEDGAHSDEPRRHARPREAEIQRRKEKTEREDQRGKGKNALLRIFLLFCIQPFFEQIGRFQK